MNKSFKLFRLQQIDSQIDQLETRVKEINLQLADDTLLVIENQNFTNKQNNLETETKNLRLAEELVQEQRNKIEVSESSLYSGRIKNPKELQDLQREVASLKNYLESLEERLITTMLSFDQAENEFFTAKNKMEILQQQIYQEQSLLRGEKNRILDDLENLKDERNAAVISIEPESLKLYEALRKQKRGVAIVRMINKTCSACGSTLSSSSSQSAQIVNQLTRCETCGRFLYGGLE